MTKLNDYLNSIKDLNIHVVGVSGTEGSEVALFLNKHGLSNVTLHDFSLPEDFAANIKTFQKGFQESELKQRIVDIQNLPYTIHYKDNYLADIDQADLIFVPQSWKMYPQNQPLQSRTTILSSLTELYLKLLPNKTIGVTGSNGKGTTTAMIHHLIPNSILTGNDRATKPILLNIENIDPDKWIILEISNRQLNQIQASPHIAVLLNITENHLDEYDSIQDYINTKARIFQFQSQQDHCFPNQDDHNTAQLFSLAPGQLHPYTLNIQSNQLVVNDIQIPTADLPILGNHNWSNLTVAIQIAQHIGIPNDQIIQAAKTFQPLKDRQFKVRTLGQTTYYNDRQGTSVDATVQAISNLPKPLVLIFGGENKGMPTNKLAAAIQENCQLAIGIKSPFVHELEPQISNLQQVDTMTEAIQLAAKQDAATVIFSPACSYGPYFIDKNKPDYLDFTNIVNSL